ncbi:MAG: hypothetical protein AAGA15_00235 [Pseudomonadota bacterium]
MASPFPTNALEDAGQDLGQGSEQGDPSIFEVLGLAQDPSLAAVLAASSVPDDVPFYTAEDGVLIMESETMKSEGSWEERTVDGEAVMLWDHHKSNYGTVNPDQELVAAFTVDKDGTFSISTHGGRVKSVMGNSELFHGDGSPRGDTGNDAYIAIKNLDTGEYVKEPTKLFVGLGQSDQDLRWGDTFENHAQGFHAARVELEQGVTYQIEITGRSDGYALDRVTINHGIHDLNDEDTPESSFTLGSTDPDAPVEPDPDIPDIPDDPADPDDPSDPVAADDGGSGSDGDDDSDAMMAVVALGLAAGLAFFVGPIVGAAGGLGALLLGASGGGAATGGSIAAVLSSEPEDTPNDEVLLSEIIPVTEILSEDAIEPSDEEETELDLLA